MLAVLVVLNLVLALYAFWLWRLDAPGPFGPRPRRRKAAIVLALVAALLVPLTGFVGWRSAVADRELDALAMSYPGAVVRWVPGEAEALGLLALFHGGAGQLAADDSVRRRALAAAHSRKPRHWHAQTTDDPARVLGYYRPILERAGWELVEESGRHLLGVRDRERFTISAKAGWTRTTIVYTWFPPGASR